MLQWAGVVSKACCRIAFPTQGEQPEFNSVDASLWYIIAVSDYLRAVEKQPRLTDDCHTEKLRAAVEAILAGYHEGHVSAFVPIDDGLLAAGEPGQQLTWMDARVDGREITPRIGKPVEIQALWLNALAIGAQFSPRWQSLFEKGRAAFESKFWNEHAGYLADVIDCDHQPGEVDLTFRPNQIFAVGGLPLQLLFRKIRRGGLSTPWKGCLLTPRRPAFARAWRSPATSHIIGGGSRSATAVIIKGQSGRG